MAYNGTVRISGPGTFSVKNAQGQTIHTGVTSATFNNYLTPITITCTEKIYGATVGPTQITGDYTLKLDGNYTIDVKIFTASYTVRFLDGSTVLKTQTVLHGNSATAPVNPTKTGYAFTSWDKSFTNITSDLDVYAQWSVKQYTATFDANGGTGGTTKTQDYGTELTAPTVTRTGYYFEGWSPEVPETMPALNGTYTAQWEGKPYPIAFNKGGGDGGTSSENARYGQPMPAITPPTRTGYTFGGYYTESGGEGLQYYTASGASARNWDIDATSLYTTLYAKWTAKTYGLVVNPNGGTYNGATGGSAISPNSGGTYLITGRSSFSAIGRATRRGYTLTGYWDTSGSSGGNKVYDANGRAVDGVYWDGSDTSATFKGLASGTSLAAYARWEPSSYTLTCNPNGGKLSGDNFGAKNGTTQTASVTVTYGKQSYAVLGRAERVGYTFTGWWTAANGGTRVFDSNGSFVIGQYWNSSRQWIYDGDVALYAQWTVKTYTVNLDLAGGTGPVSSVRATYGRALPDLGASNVPTRSGYLFGGFYSGAGGAGQRYYSATGVANDALTWQTDGGGTLYAKWSRRVNVEMASACTDNGGAFPQIVATRPTVRIAVGGDTAQGETADAVAVEGDNVSVYAAATWRPRADAAKGMTFSHFVVTAGSQVIVDAGAAVQESDAFKYCTFIVPGGIPTNENISVVAYYDRDRLVVATGIDSFARQKGISQNLASVVFDGGGQITDANPARFGDSVVFAAGEASGYSFFGWSENYDQQQGVVSNAQPYSVVAYADVTLYARYAYRTSVAVESIDASGAQTTGGGTVSVSVGGASVQDPSSAFLVPIGSAMRLSSTASQGFYFSYVVFAPEGGTGDQTTHGGNDEIFPDESGTYTVVFKASPPYVYLACADVAEDGTSGEVGSTTATYNGQDAEAFYEVDREEAAAVLDVSGVPTDARWYKVRQGTTVSLVATRSSASQGTILERMSYTDVGLERLAEQYVLIVDPNGGVHKGYSVAHQVSPDGEGHHLTLNKSTFWAIGTATRDGYTLVGFYDAASGGNMVYDGDGHAADGLYWNGSGSSARFKGAPSTTLTVYARWSEGNGSQGAPASLLDASPAAEEADAPDWIDRTYSVSGDRLITTTWGLYSSPKVTLVPQQGGRAVFVGVDPVGGEDVHEKEFDVVDGAYQTATVRAIPDPSGGYNFAGWARDGVVVATTADYSFEVRANCTLVAMFTLDDNAVFAWEGGRRNKRMKWTSGVLTCPRPEDPVAVRVDAEKYPVFVEVSTHSSPEAGGETRVHQVSVGLQAARRLPRMKAERYWQVSVESTEEVDAVVVATNIVEAN